MAFRFVYQISCNVNKPVILGNSSAECIRRFRSLSPVLQSSHRQSHSWVPTRRRSQSFPSQELLRSDRSYSFDRRKRLVTTEDENEQEVEEYETDDYQDKPTYQSTSARKRGQSKGKTQINKSRTYSDQNSYGRESRSEKKPAELKIKPRNVASLNKEAEVKLLQYHLKDSKPSSKENVFDVFEYYSDQYRWKDTKVLPHLQPHNLKPYGTGENLLFPIYSTYKRKAIKYPILEPGYTEQVSKTYQRKNQMPDKVKSGPSNSEQRDYSTLAPTQQADICQKIIDEYKKTNPGYVAPKNKVTLAPGSTEEHHFLQKTIKLISDFNRQQIEQNHNSTKNSDLGKCNQIISDYKKLNQDYAFTKKEQKSKTGEEKEVVNDAVNFASTFKRYFHNNSLTNKTVTEIQVKENLDNTETLDKSQRPTEIKEVKALSLHNILQKCTNSPATRKKYSFSDVLPNLPQVPVTPVRVRVGPKANLLQSAAPPETTKFWEEVRLEKNERLVSPWPSYAEVFKNLIPKRKRQITYPVEPNSDTKTFKNTANLEIKSKIMQSNLDSSTRSLHTNMKLTTATQIPDVNRLANIIITLNPKARNSLPDLRFFHKRCYSSSSKGTLHNEETVTPKCSKFKNDSVCDSTELEYSPDSYNACEYISNSQKPMIEVSPIKRLKKNNERFKNFTDKEDCVPRADARLVIKQKKLPVSIPPEDCLRSDIKFKNGGSLSHFKKKSVKTTLKVHPFDNFQCDCPPKSEAGLKVKLKCLPKTIGQASPKQEVLKVAPLKPIKELKIPEPQNCFYDKSECVCPLQADILLKVKKKKLLKRQLNDCSSIESILPEKIPTSRFKKIKDQYVSEDVVCTYRKFQSLEKSLPNFVGQDNSGKPEQVQDRPSLTHLKKNINFKKYPEIRFVKKEGSTSNFNTEFKITPKILPCVIPSNDCLRYKQQRKEDCILKHLNKKLVQELRKITPEQKFSKINFDNASSLKPIQKHSVAKSEKIDIQRQPCVQADADTKKKQFPKQKALDYLNIENEASQNIPVSCLQKPKFKYPSRIYLEDDLCDNSQNIKAVGICESKAKPKTFLQVLLDIKSSHVNIKKNSKKLHPPTVNASYKRRFSAYSRTNTSDKVKSIRFYNNKSRGHKSEEHINPGCCYIEPNYPNNDITPELQRLPKFKKNDIQWSKLRECIIKCGKMPRADANWKSEKKPLPVLTMGKCPCVESSSYEQVDQPRLKRLPKFEKPDIDWKVQKVCIKPCRKAPRADDGVKFKKKSLPKIKISDCPANDPYASLCDMAPLKRLGKFYKEDRDWKNLKQCIPICIRSNPRADTYRKPRAKSLPRLRFSNCPCVEKKSASDQPKLKRLPKFEKPDIEWKVQKVCIKPCGKMPRADDSLKQKKKSLPKLRLSECPCYDPRAFLSDMPPLKRLPKFEKPDVQWKTVTKCIPVCIRSNPRADHNLQHSEKQLPSLKPLPCPCIERNFSEEKQPKLKRLPKFEKPDVDWKVQKMCIIPCKRMPRADANLKLKNKTLPKIKTNDCPTNSSKTTTNLCDVAPLKRLAKFQKQDIDWKRLSKCIPICMKSNPRADHNLKPRDKSLPCLRYSKCPCVERKIPDEEKQPILRRLQKFEKPDIDWKVQRACIKPCGKMPRADENLKYRKKSLPKLKTRECPFHDPCATLCDFAPLRGLNKFQHPDINWKNVSKCIPVCKSNPKADDNRKLSKKYLPCSRTFLYPDVGEKAHNNDNQNQLKRIWKIDKPSTNWMDHLTCKSCQNSKVFDNLNIKNGSLTKFKDDKLSGIDNFADLKNAERIKQLVKFSKEDIDWTQLKKFTQRCSSKLRVDNNIERKTKSLSQLKVHPCPYVEEEYPLEEILLKRLNKLEAEEDVNWNVLPNCIQSCKKTARADKLLGYQIKKKKLPPLLPPLGEKQYHTAGSRSYPIYPVYRDLTYIYHQSMRTSAVLSRKKKTKRSQNLECKTKEHNKVDAFLQSKCSKLDLKKKKCVPRSKPPLTKICDGYYESKQRAQRKSPYPSFSEYGEIPDVPVCECAVPDIKILQPKYPILTETVLQQPPLPEYTSIDLLKEKKCLMKKLGIVDDETKTCKIYENASMELDEGQTLTEAEKQVKHEIISVTEVGQKARDKSNSGLDKQCQLVFLDACCTGDPEPDAQKKPSRFPPPIPRATSSKRPVSKSSTVRSVATKSSSGACPPNVTEQKKSKSIWEKICDLFKSQPKKSAASQSNKSSKGNKWISKPPTKKGVSKVKRISKPQRRIIKKNKKVEGKKTTKIKSKNKKSKSTEKISIKNSQLAADTMQCIANDPPKKKAQTDMQSHCKPKKETDPCKKPSKPKKNLCKLKKDPCKKPSKPKDDLCKIKEDPCNKPSKPKDDLCKIKEDPCKKHSKLKEDLCKIEKDPCKKPSKPKEDLCKIQKDPCEQNKFANMFPPDLPDCRPRYRIRRDSCQPTTPSRPSRIPMEDCIANLRAGKLGYDNNAQSIDPCQPNEDPCKPRTNPCKLRAEPCKPSADPCTPKKDPCIKKTTECKPITERKSKDEITKSECKPKPPKAQGKCKKIPTDCPPKARDSCEVELVFKECKGQPSPYPSFSECRPPSPKGKISECIVAKQNAKNCLSRINMYVTKNQAKDKCNEEEKPKGRKCYSTMTLAAKALAFRVPNQWKRNFSSSVSRRGYTHSAHILNKIQKKAINSSIRGKKILNQRLVASIKEGIEKMESQDTDLTNNPYYQILKALQKLSEREIHDFFDQEHQFNPFDQLKGNVRETVSYVSKVNPKAEHSSILSSDLSFEPSCVGISDVNAQLEEFKIIGAFRSFYNRICNEPEVSNLSYQESEQVKTEAMQQELDELLNKAKLK